MRKLSQKLLLLPLFFCPLAEAEELYSTAPQRWGYVIEGGLSVEGEFLYLKPGVESSYYAIRSFFNLSDGNIHPNGRRAGNDPSFAPGFRVALMHDLCSDITHLEARFTYLNTSHSNSLSGTLLFDTNGYPGDGSQAPEDTFYTGQARLRQNFHCYTGDTTLSRSLLQTPYEEFSFLLGVHYAYLQVNDNGSSLGTSAGAPVTNYLVRKSHFWGLGPEFGIDYQRDLPCFSALPGRVSFLANCRAALLASRTQADLLYLTTRTGSAGVKLNNDPLWRVTPWVDAKMGLNYQRCICGFETTFKAGYELIWYGKCVNTITGTDVAFAGDSIDLFSDLSLQGPYIALNIAF